MTLATTHVNLRDAFAVWRRNAEVHLRVWKMNLIAPAIEPVFSVLAFGWGFGALVAGKVSGISYLSFVGAGILGLTVLMRAMFETTYAAYFRMVYQSTYDAILATPVDAESLAFAEILWIDLTRALLTGRFLWRHAYEAVYLVISAVVACEWAMRSLRRRMVA